MTSEQIEDTRPAFERFYSDDGNWPKSVERKESGSYKLTGCYLAWIAWKAAKADAVPAVWRHIQQDSPIPWRDSLIATSNGHVTTGTYSPGFGWVWEPRYEDPDDAKVTHWMPLPVAPQIGDKNED